MKDLKEILSIYYGLGTKNKQIWTWHNKKNEPQCSDAGCWCDCDWFLLYIPCHKPSWIARRQTMLEEEIQSLGFPESCSYFNFESEQKTNKKPLYKKVKIGTSAA